MFTPARVSSAVLALVLLALYSCGGSTSHHIGTVAVTGPAKGNPVTWPATLPTDALQPWERSAGSFKTGAGINPQSEFIPGAERFNDSVTGVAGNGEAVRMDSGTAGSSQVAWAIYRVPMDGNQPGAVSVDINLLEMDNGSLSGYYIGLSDYSRGAWDWHGPFTDNHVRLSTGADAASGTDYLSGLGNLFVCAVAFDGARFDLVGLGVNPVVAGDTDAPAVPTGLHAAPVAGGLELNWDDVAAGDLAGYRLYYSNSTFTSTGQDGVECVPFLIGDPGYILTGLMAKTFLRLSAVDINGNESDLAGIISETPLTGNPPELRLTADEPSGMLNGVITLTATGAESYAWDLDGDGDYEVSDDPNGIQQADTGRTGIIRPRVRATSGGARTACGAVSLLIAGNSRPVASALASPSSGKAPLAVTLTGTGEDVDGSLVSYSWDFDGDGIYDSSSANDPGPVNHTYTEPGLYNAKFRVEDDLHYWDVDTVSVQVLAGANHAPVAALTTDVTSGIAPLLVSLDASGTEDPDEEAGDSIARFMWDFNGDGVFEGISTTALVNHTFETPGVFNVAVMAEDTHGAVDTATVEITVNVAGNDPPVADVTASPDTGDFPLTVSFDATSSSDPDGSIVRYDWDFDGDGNFELYDGGGSPDLEYTVAGAFEAKVRVTDDAGAQDIDTVTINVNVPGNDSPVADLTPVTVTNTIPFTVNFDASGSTDSDGTIVTYEWDFDGNGSYDSYGDDPMIDHTYYNYGSFTAKLRVTDDAGAQGTATAAITARAKPVAVLTATPQDLEADGTVYLHAEGSYDPDGSIVNYEWSLDGDNAYNEAGQEAGEEGNDTVALEISGAGVYRVRLRVTDTDGYTDFTLLEIARHGWLLSNPDCSNNLLHETGSHCSVAVVNGRPAIAYYNMYYERLYYVYATDKYGSDWNYVHCPDSSSDVGLFTSMTVVDGNPAISYYRPENTSLKYVRATTATGSSWGSAVNVYNTDDVGKYTSLSVVDGNPAISFYDETNGDLLFVRATDSVGGAWGSPVTVVSADDVGQHTSLLMVNGHPAISYLDVTNSDLMFVRAIDTTGSTWNTPVTVDSVDNVGRYNSMAIVNGYPAISYYDYTNNDLKYVRAENLNGGSWGTPITLDSEGNVGQHTSLAVCDGFPAIAYFDPTNDEAKFIQALNANGNTWDTPVAVGGGCGGFCALAEFNGNPGFAYYKSNSLDLKFAYRY